MDRGTSSLVRLGLSLRGLPADRYSSRTFRADWRRPGHISLPETV
ncbi:hypothetical protein RISK_003551 [Rhodopirellula islandica]|uniref:Uncharacterized protein n=1 Tax=Rhodopirellula islandica TaxID=595434 RepID=A0A0J1BD10_RHOIS|nr:hypothetical protein RISK_003551 [Rhodopirellula islandica]